VRQAVLEALGVPESLLPLLASLVGNDFVEQASLSALHGALLPGRHASGGPLIEAVGAELRRAAAAVGWDGSGSPPLQLWEALGGGGGAVLDAVARGKVEASLAQYPRRVEAVEAVLLCAPISAREDADSAALAGALFAALAPP